MNNINLDLDRDIWCLLGLPVDALTMNDVVTKLHLAIANKQPLFLSTPNLNFLIASQCDSAFKRSVINSDLSIADGKPLVWLARILGLPIPERVAGSDLIESFIKDKTNKPIKVFFFGGQDGIAEIACATLSNNNTGLECVGYLNPGFGSIEDMSSSNIINTINKSCADFIIVSLGAKKGQTWIQKNKEVINAPVISHLGAVVNFIAGTVKRSPKVMQTFGLEWLWRIKEEPTLWKRYVKDAFSLVRLFFLNVLPLYVLIKRECPSDDKQKGTLTREDHSNEAVIILSGFWGNSNITEINAVYKQVIEQTMNVAIHINNGSYIDSAFVAKTMLLENALKLSGRQLVIKTKSSLIINIFRYNYCEYLLR